MSEEKKKSLDEQIKEVELRRLEAEEDRVWSEIDKNRAEEELVRKQIN